jgi:hypothetical protein
VAANTEPLAAHHPPAPVFIIPVCNYAKEAREIIRSATDRFHNDFSGGMGNITDRVLYNRHVTDFINLGIMNIRTGIFNVADLYVTIGVLMLLIGYIRTKPGNEP